MKTLSIVRFTAFILFVCIFNAGFVQRAKEDGSSLTGAWSLQSSEGEEVIIFIDNYFTNTGYIKTGRKFEFTRGGKFRVQQDKLMIDYEFDTHQKDQIGQTVTYNMSIDNDRLSLNMNGKKEIWTRIDNGNKNLAGLWHITARKQDEKVVPIHQTGPRKTVKILSATRFQWAAINPETKEFFGTGGGTYTFNAGKYTENIEFFSRDSSRVGASLSFDGKLEKGDWHHSGLSSKGDSIYEVWSRVK
jgi:hypothetical protein